MEHIQGGLSKKIVMNYSPPLGSDVSLGWSAVVSHCSHYFDFFFTISFNR